MPAGTAITLPAMALAAIVGLTAGLGGFAFTYAKGDSYLTDEPQACANCHVMQGHFDDWQKSSHHAVAVCNDCHTPAGPVAKYVVKAQNGFHHSMAFTLGGHPENIQARETSREVIEGQCRHCHADLVFRMTGGAEGVSCLRCHDSVGHAR